MNYFLYCRKSSDREDKQILSNDAQQRIMTKFAEENRLTVIKSFVEQKSAYKRGRPLFGEMVHRLEEGEADAILTYHLTRLARNSFDGGHLIGLMDEGSIKEIRTPGGIHVNTPDHKFMMQIEFAMAKKSSDDTSQFVTRDIESKLLKGECTGCVPLGYLNLDRAGRIVAGQYEPEKQRMLESLGRPLKREEIDPVLGSLVRRVFEESSKGVYSLKALSEFAYRIGLRSRKGKRLPLETIYQLLTHPYFRGALRLRGKLYTENIQHEALVPKKLFDRVQQIVGRRKGGMRKHFFAFTGLIKCAECGCAITAEIQRGLIYYHCTHNHGPCSQRTWTREDALEEQLTNAFSRLIIPDVLLQFMFDKVRQCHAQEAKGRDAIRNQLERQYGQAKHRLDALLQLKLSQNNVDGLLLSDEEYLSQKNAVREEMQSLEEELQTAQQQGKNWVEDCEKFVNFTQELCKRFVNASLEEKKELVYLLCSNITLKDQKIAVESREPFATLAAFSEEHRSALERRPALTEKKEFALAQKWLDVLDGIRTYLGMIPIRLILSRKESSMLIPGSFLSTVSILSPR